MGWLGARGLVLGLVLLSGGWTPQTQGDPTVGLLGQEVTVCVRPRGATGARIDVPLVVTVQDALWRPASDSGLLALALAVRNTGDAPASALGQLRLVDGRGRLFDPASDVPLDVLTTVEAAFDAPGISFVVQPGLSQVRHLIFRLPPDAQGLQLRARTVCPSQDLPSTAPSERVAQPSATPAPVSTTEAPSPLVAGLIGQQVQVCSFALGGPLTGRAEVPITVTVVDGIWLPGERSGLLAVAVEARNDGASPTSILNTLRLQDNRGRQYDTYVGAPAALVLAVEQAFNARDDAAALQPGVPERRRLLFQLPLDVASVRLITQRACEGPPRSESEPSRLQVVQSRGTPTPVATLVEPRPLVAERSVFVAGCGVVGSPCDPQVEEARRVTHGGR